MACQGFNEAAASTLRKLAEARGPVAAVSRFNEAAASTLRKSDAAGPDAARRGRFNEHAAEVVGIRNWSII